MLSNTATERSCLAFTLDI